MNNIIIIDSIVVIVVMIEIEQVENGSFQNQTESPLARRLPRRASRQGPPLCEGLKPRSTPRETLKRQVCSGNRCFVPESSSWRAELEGLLSESATKELALAEYMQTLMLGHSH